MHPQNETGKKRLSFASQQCKITLPCTDTERHRKTEIHSCTKTFLQSRFSTVGLLIILKTVGDVEKSRVFNGCRAPMDTQPTRIFLHGRQAQMKERDKDKAILQRRGINIQLFALRRRDHGDLE
ncbi:hypothetical protein TNCV_983451 [Trichonephila clavipes]|nr:hypothetical protein TNCV_983451 [Trichonephila clavipes]